MLLLLLVWSALFIFLFLIGKGISNIVFPSAKFSIDQQFLFGFLSVSLFASYYSIIAPLNVIPLALLGFIVVLLALYKKSLLSDSFTDFKEACQSLSKIDVVLIVLIVVYLAAIASRNITDYDTGLYHAQSIMWLKDFSVVPGLGNLHGRLAFNPMFFPVTAMFTIDTTLFGGILIYPFNGLAFIVLLIKMLSLIRITKIESINRLVYIFAFFIVILLLTVQINSPQPDVICTILIIYAFIQLIEFGMRMPYSNFLLLAGLVFLTVTFKLSSLFLALILIPVFINSFSWITFLRLASIGVAIVLPFLIRNYYLSGYLIYPFPGLDIFDVDWKIPLRYVQIEKWKVETWARLPHVPFSEVLEKSISEWFPIWFSVKTPIQQKILVICALTPITLLVLLWKKYYKLLIVQSIIFVNLLFWFYQAPNFRFALGFFCMSTAITVGLVLHLLRVEKLLRKAYSVQLALVIIVGYSAYTNRPILKQVALNMKQWVLPLGLDTIESTQENIHFTYYKPIEGDRCYQTPIPCTPYVIDKLELRGDGLANGFKIVRNNPSTQKKKGQKRKNENTKKKKNNRKGKNKTTKKNGS